MSIQILCVDYIRNKTKEQSQLEDIKIKMSDYKELLKERAKFKNDSKINKLALEMVLSFISVSDQEKLLKHVVKQVNKNDVISIAAEKLIKEVNNTII